MSSETKTVIISETTKVDSVNSYALNADFVKFLVLLLIVFLVIVIIGNNSKSLYFTSTLPSWALSLATWLFLIAIVFMFTAYGMMKADFQADDMRANWFKFGMFVVLVLFLVSVFIIFQTNNFRAAFWTQLAGLIILIILMFFVGSQSRAAAALQIPLLLIQILFLVEVWQIVQLNNY